MRSAPNPAVADDLDLAVYGIHDLAQLIERRATAVKLPAAVVRNHDRIGPDFDRAARVGGAHYALQAELPAPILPDPRRRVPIHRGIEHGVKIVEIGRAHV